MHIMPWNIAGEEIKKNKFLLETIHDSHIKSRIENNLEWFIQKAVKAKYMFFCFSTITIIAPVISSLIIDFQDCSLIIKIISSVLAAASSISASLLNLFNCRKNWSLYRNQAETIKRILSKNLSKSNYDEKKMLEEIENSIYFTDKTFIEDLDKNN